MATKQRPPFTEIFFLSARRVRRDEHEHPPRFDGDVSTGANSQVAIYQTLDRVTVKTAVADWLISQNAARNFKQSDFDEFKAEVEAQREANRKGKLKRQSSSAESSEAQAAKTRRAS